MTFQALRKKEELFLEFEAKKNCFGIIRKKIQVFTMSRCIRRFFRPRRSVSIAFFWVEQKFVIASLDFALLSRNIKPYFPLFQRVNTTIRFKNAWNMTFIMTSPETQPVFNPNFECEQAILSDFISHSNLTSTGSRNARLRTLAHSLVKRFITPQKEHPLIMLRLYQYLVDQLK